jgi:TetR/AcrR family transcriptional regulator
VYFFNRGINVQASEVSTAATRQSAGEIAILKAAIRLFSENGFDGVSMRSVAEIAGVSKANIYHHFASKEALYLAIMQESAQKLSVLVDNLEEGDGDFEQRLRVFAQGHLDHLFGNASTLRLILREVFSGDDEKGRVLVEQVVGGILLRLFEIFKEGQEAGVLRAGLDPALCAMLLLGVDLFYFQSHGMLKHIPQAGFALQREQYSREMMDVILNGMLVQDVEAGVQQ